MNSLEFAQPHWLLAGSTIVLGICFAFRYFDRRNQRDLEKFVDSSLLGKVSSSVSKPLRWTKRISFAAAVLFLFAALARPQFGYEWREVKRRGIDILFALDASRSMLAEDVAPNRLERAKLGMLDFVSKLEGDRVGLMPFAGSAFLLCPLTLDYEAFRQSLDAIDTDIIPRKGTDLASAIREATRTFEEAGNNHRILVVITDGEDLQGEALKAAKHAAEDGMVIHTIGIGSAEGELIPIASQSGTDFLRDQKGELVRSKLDEESLRAIAASTGGLYAPFGQHAEGLTKIYQEKLRLVPKEELSQRMQKIPIERYQWPLAAAILLFLIDFILGDRRRRTQASLPTAQPSTTTVAALVLALGLIPLADGFAATLDPRQIYNDGVASYQKGDFESAETAFQNAIESSSDVEFQARSYYNLGNTLFKSGSARLAQDKIETVIVEWEKSLTAFDGSLALNPDDADAQFNRDLVQRKIDELRKQQQKEQDDTDSSEQNSEENTNEEKASSSEKESETGKEEKNSQENKSEPPEEGGEKKGENGSESGEKKKREGEPSIGNQEGEEPQESVAPQPQGGEISPDEINPKNGEQAGADQERRNPGEMSKEEAKQLLEALENDEERVLLVPARNGDPHAPDNTTNGKDW